MNDLTDERQRTPWQDLFSPVDVKEQLAFKPNKTAEIENRSALRAELEVGGKLYWPWLLGLRIVHSRIGRYELSSELAVAVRTEEPAAAAGTARAAHRRLPGRQPSLHQ